mgnify:CR=1 FL=1
MEYLVIYLIGFLLSYYSGRYYMRSNFENYNYKDVFINFMFGLSSYIGFIIFIGIIIIETDIMNNEPPKFL